METATSLIEAAENTEVWRVGRELASAREIEEHTQIGESEHGRLLEFLNELMLANDVTSVRKHQGKAQFVNSTTAMSSIVDPLLLSLEQQCIKIAQMHRIQIS